MNDYEKCIDDPNPALPVFPIHSFVCGRPHNINTAYFWSCMPLFLSPSLFPTHTVEDTWVWCSPY